MVARRQNQARQTYEAVPSRAGLKCYRPHGVPMSRTYQVMCCTLRCHELHLVRLEVLSASSVPVELPLAAATSVRLQ
jgi:hypothetical protein